MFAEDSLAEDTLAEVALAETALAEDTLAEDALAEDRPCEQEPWEEWAEMEIGVEGASELSHLAKGGALCGMGRRGDRSAGGAPELSRLGEGGSLAWRGLKKNKESSRAPVTGKVRYVDKAGQGRQNNTVKLAGLVEVLGRGLGHGEHRLSGSLTLKRHMVELLNLMCLRLS